MSDQRLDRRYFLAATAAGLSALGILASYTDRIAGDELPAVVATPLPTAPAAGPMIGHVDTDSVRIWFRPGDDHLDIRDWSCVLELGGRPAGTATAHADPAHDFTMVFQLGGLAANTRYRYQIYPSAEAARDDATTFGPFAASTAPDLEQQTRVVLGMGSCAPSDPNRVWQQIVDEGCEGFVFLGDTPYIDSSDLKVVREKHRRFLTQPEIATMIAQMPCWGTWDDHDFGGNDTHGDSAAKHACRTGFTEYRAHKEYGHRPDGSLQTARFGDGEGIYTSFRRGPLEVFLIDPRWFSRTEPSWADPEEPTCLGSAQWEWLRDGLKKSTAPFKALACGMIWDDKQNSESDDWHTYRHEREAIFDFIRDEEIAGCFLIGGDIHVSRALNYGPRVGYDLWQFIVSPLHGSTIPSLDTPHPCLVHHAVEPFVFLRLEADDRQTPATLTATWINREGKRIFEVALDEEQLAATR
jgi:phosphodiesterase/alkaline phosphatase D-like protein